MAESLYNDYLHQISNGKHRICAGKLVTSGYWLGELRKYNSRFERSIRPFFYGLDEDGKPIQKIKMPLGEFPAHEGDGRMAVDPVQLMMDCIKKV